VLLVESNIAIAVQVYLAHLALQQTNRNSDDEVACCTTNRDLFLMHYICVSKQTVCEAIKASNKQERLRVVASLKVKRTRKILYSCEVELCDGLGYS
jgi:hypothetical protein